MAVVRLDSETLLRLRDELRRSGERRSIAPAAPEQVPPDVLAIVQRVSPICELLYLVMVADGRSDARELEVMRGAIRALTEDSLRGGVIEGMLRTFEVASSQSGRETRLARVTAQLSADRQDAEAAFTLAAVMVIADDSPDLHERIWLEELRQLLGIKPPRAAELLGELGMH